VVHDVVFPCPADTDGGREAEDRVRVSTVAPVSEGPRARPPGSTGRAGQRDDEEAGGRGDQDVGGNFAPRCPHLRDGEEA